MSSPASPTSAGALGFLDLIEAAERDALLALGRRFRAPRATTLMHQGEPGDRVMILLAGRVKVTRVSAHGREALLAICDPGALLGELAVIDAQSRDATITTIEPVDVLAIPSSVFCAHVERVPRLAMAMLEVLTGRLRQATHWRTHEVPADTLGRLATRIVELVDRYGEPSETGIEISLPLSQEEITSWTAASRAGVTSALQTMRQLGWIETGRRRIVVRDVEAVRGRAV